MFDLFSSPGGGNKTAIPSSLGVIHDDRLRGAAERFYQFRGKLVYLDKVLRRHLNDLCSTMASRALVAQALGSVSENSPLYSLVGATGNEGVNADKDHMKIAWDNDYPVEIGADVTIDSNWIGQSNSDGFAEVSSCPSYAALQAKAGHEASSHLERYENEVAKYVTEWEKTVSTRVATEIKHIQTLYKTMEKYNDKVRRLAESIEQQKKKNVSKKKRADLESKKGRNEQKLRVARTEYRRNLIAGTLLTEEVALRGFKDLIPLMTRLIDLDIHSVTNTTTMDVGDQLAQVRRRMLELAKRYEMDFDAIRTGRLRVLLEEDAAAFCDPAELQSVEENTVVGNRHRRNHTHSSFQSPATSNTSSSASSSREGPVVTPEQRKNIVSATRKRTRGRLPCPPPSLGEERMEIHNKKMNKISEDNDNMDCDDDDDSYQGPNYPKSIYISDKQDGRPFIDDETTLTGQPDLVSV